MLPGLANSQSADWDQRVAFAEQIRNIRYVAYIRGDQAYRCYTDAITSIEDQLSHKGYTYTRVYFNPSSGQNFDVWKQFQIRSLPAGEAFLEVQVTSGIDSSATGVNTGTVLIQDGNGNVYMQHEIRPGTADMIKYQSSSEAKIYLKPADSLSNIEIFYSKKASVGSASAGDAAARSLRGITSSHHPAAKPKPVYLNSGGKTRIEFVIFGGYCAGAQIRVTEGTAMFEPGPDYGLEMMVNVYKGLDVAVGYKREDTFADVDSPKYPKEGDLALSNNYILLGAIYRFFQNKSLQPYLGFDFGSVNVVPKDKFFRDVWYFAIGGRAGCNWYVNKFLGFRLQTQLLYQVHPKDAPFLYSDELREMPYPVNADQNLPQFDVTFGLVFRLGK